MSLACLNFVIILATQKSPRIQRRKNPGNIKRCIILIKVTHLHDNMPLVISNIFKVSTSSIWGPIPTSLFDSLLQLLALGWPSIKQTNKQTHRLGSEKNRHLFLTILEAGSPSSGCQCGQVVVRTPFLAICSHGGKRELLFWSLLMRALIPSWGHHPHDLI